VFKQSWTSIWHLTGCKLKLRMKKCPSDNVFHRPLWKIMKKKWMGGFKNTISYMIMMMYRLRFKPYFKRPNCISVLTDKNIMTPDDLYLCIQFHFFIAFLANRLNRISFHGSSFIKKTYKRSLSRVPLVTYRCVYWFTLILRAISIRIGRLYQMAYIIIQSYRCIWSQC